MPKPKKPKKPRADTRAGEAIDAPKIPCKGKRVIVLDPGHGGFGKKLGGSDANHAEAVSGPLEKELTLDFAKRLRKSLESPAVQKLLPEGCSELEVVMTRETDVNLSLSDRVAVATKHKADIFLSLHFNGDNDRSVHGTETFYKDPKNAYQANAAADKALAQKVNQALFGAFAAVDPSAKNRGVKPDTMTRPKALGILNDPGPGSSGKMCRSVIAEIEYISNVAVDKRIVSGPNAEKNRDAAMLAVAEVLVKEL